MSSLKYKMDYKYLAFSRFDISLSIIFRIFNNKYKNNKNQKKKNDAEYKYYNRANKNGIQIE